MSSDAQLPALPVGQLAAGSERLILEAADGNRFNATAASPLTESQESAVVVLPDVRGLFEFYEDLACRFAEHGHPAVAIDYFGRTAGTEGRDADFPFMDHIAQTNTAGINADIAAAVAYLRQAHPDRRIYTVGFCFGGSLSWAASTHDHGLAGVVGFYGKPDVDRPAGDGAIWERCHLIDSPVLGLFGAADPSIPPETVDRFTHALEDAHVDHQIVSYPGAPHSFFDRSQGEYGTESLDAWNRINAFIS